MFASSPLPSAVDNHNRIFFPEVISQIGESCANASGIGYVFTYEINASCNTAANTDTTQYPYFTTYNYLNDGSEQQGTHRMFIDAWKFSHDNGIMNLRDFGSIEPRSTKWVTGYSHYLNAMRNRVSEIDSFRISSPEGLTYFKQLLFDKGTGSPFGSLFLITASVRGVQDATLNNDPEKNKYIITALGTDSSTGLHTLTVTGYNDDINYDFNGDGAITTTTDINGDGKITLADSERGAFRCANTWGDANWDSGFVYLPYRLFFVSVLEGGTYSKYGYHITVRKEYSPRRTLKLSLNHKMRNALSVAVGISSDTSSTTPEHLRVIEQLNYRGGALPMCGKGASSSIELGLDISDLSDSIDTPGHSACFLIIDSKDSTGKCTALSLIDYSQTPPLEISVPGLPQTIRKGLTHYKIVTPALAVTPPRTSSRTLSTIQFRCIPQNSLHFSGLGFIRLQLFDGKGVCIINQPLSPLISQHRIRLPLSQGIYFVRLCKVNTFWQPAQSVVIH